VPGYAASFEATPLDRTARMTIGAARLALSPRDLDRFVAEVGRGA
jgi:hypothetical protein